MNVIKLMNKKLDEAYSISVDKNAEYQNNSKNTMQVGDYLSKTKIKFYWQDDIHKNSSYNNITMNFYGSEKNNSLKKII